MYGANGLWLFSAVREDAVIGTHGWTTGISRSSSNDPIYVWAAAPHSGVTIPAAKGSRSLVVTQALASTARRDLRAEAGHLLAGGMVLRSGDALPQTGDFSVAIGVLIPPTGDGPIVGVSQANSESWQIVATGTKIEFHLRHVVAPHAVVQIGEAARGTVQRIALSRSGTAWSWDAGAGAGSRIDGAVARGSGHLWIGAGTAHGTYAVRTLDGLVLTDAEVWYRALTLAEINAVREKAYPR
jgi:hypothetical protein